MNAGPEGAIFAAGVSLICAGVAAYTLVDGLRSGVMRPAFRDYGREFSRQAQPGMFWFFAAANGFLVVLFLGVIVVISLQGLGVLKTPR